MGNEKQSLPPEEYLKAIFILQLKNGTVEMQDVAAFLDATKPSVRNAAEWLKQAAYVESEHTPVLTLTPKGESYAADLLRRHKMLKRFLQDTVGLCEKTAEADAVQIERALSAETVQGLYRYLESCENRKE